LAFGRADGTEQRATTADGIIWLKPAKSIGETATREGGYASFQQSIDPKVQE